MVLWTLLAFASSADAQAALAATTVTQGRLPPNARLTLRPAPEFEQLAVKVARVLTLRGNATVEIGDAPPPGLLEAVAAGHIAIASGATQGAAHLVLGAAMGDSYETTIILSPDGEEDARALALAIEALRDRAIEAREHYENTESAPANGAADELAAAQAREGAYSDTAQWQDAQGQPIMVAALAPMPSMPPMPPMLIDPSDSAQPLQPMATDEALGPEGDAQGAQHPSGTPAPAVQSVAAPGVGSGSQVLSGNPYQLVGDPRDADDMLPRPDPSERALKVKLRLYVGVYGGASSESRALRTGVGTGGGLCVRGQCLLLGLEYPLPLGLEQGANDIRYRYPTFSCTFLSQPFVFGPFTPGLSVGLVSRIGHFDRDMGRTNYQSGLDTDLGFRGSVEGAFEVIESVDVVAQAGFDYALDRWQYSDAVRGSRMAPWLQAGIRFRPE